MKWFPEVLLHRYWVERCFEDGYTLNGHAIRSATLNPSIDRYPDIVANAVDGYLNPLPAEVEWATDNFRAHGHDIDVLSEADGFLIVVKKSQEFPLPQVELQIPAFKDWLQANSKPLFDETLAVVEELVGERRGPRGWIVWRSRGLLRNLTIGLEHGLWGFPDKLSAPRLANAQAIRKGDLLIFVGPWRKAARQTTVYGGRISDEQFLQGMLETIAAYPVVRSYFQDMATVWPSGSPERWRHRVEINPTPVFEGTNIRTNRGTLGPHLTEVLRRAMVAQSSPQEIPEHLVLSLLSAIARSNSPRGRRIASEDLKVGR